jgi:hypothetical protein
MVGTELPMIRADPNVMAAALSHLLRFGVGDGHNEVIIEAELFNGGWQSFVSTHSDTVETSSFELRGSTPHGSTSRAQDKRTVPLVITIRTSQTVPVAEDPQKLLDPSYVLEHPDIDLGPSASQRLIESQGGVLEVSLEEGNIVFKIFLVPYPDPSIVY